ncbi:MAG TPA: SpoIIE family protein phosphatase [Acidimicrobiales bacterium]
MADQGGPLGPASHLAILADAARRLHGEGDTSRLVGWTLEATADLAGLSDVALCLLPHDATATWWVHPRSTLNFALLGDPRTVPLIQKALDTAPGVVYTDLATAEARLAPEQRVRRIVPVAGLAVVPVVGGTGVLRGALLVGWNEGAAFVADVRPWLGVLASHLGVAIENKETLARMAEEEARGKEVVHRLQQAVRPPAPVVPFTELGVHYVAADPSAPTGGDLYDWLVLPSGELHLTVVDVMGKGVQATKDALLVTHALRLLAVDGCPLADIVRRADELISAQNPELVATLLVARYWPGTGQLQLAGAGHPPALLVHRGDASELAAPGIPIGWPGAGSHGVVETYLERADTLILYTDGLIEARKDILRGLDELAAAARATAGYPATSLARVLVDRALADAARHDDSLALVLRRRSPPDTAPLHVLGPFHHRFSPNPAAVPIARHLLRDWLVRVPVDPDAVDSMLLVASELATNATRHASKSVAFEARVEGDAIVLEVTDDGGGLAPLVENVDGPPDPEVETGRGLFLVRELSDDVVATVHDGVTVVRVVKRAVIGDVTAPAAPVPERRFPSRTVGKVWHAPSSPEET